MHRLLKKPMRHKRQTFHLTTGHDSVTLKIMSFAQALKALALNAILRVNTIHANIRGTDLQGRPYAAAQAELLGFADALSFDARAEEILQRILAYPVDVLDKPWMALMDQAPACAVQKQATRLAVQLSAEPVQWMLNQQGVSAIARQRVQGGGQHA